MIGLGHRAKVRDQAAGVGRRRVARLLSVQLTHDRCCRSRGNGAQHGSRMPALLVVTGIAAQQFGPDFVARDIGCHHIQTTGTERLGFGKYRRNQHRAGVSRQGLVVIIQRMRRGATEQCGVGASHHVGRQTGARLVPATGLNQGLAHDVHHGFRDAHHDYADRVGKSIPDQRQHAIGQMAIPGIGDKASEVCSQCRHCVVSLRSGM